MLVLKIALGIILAFAVIGLASCAFTVAVLKGVTSALPTPRPASTFRAALVDVTERPGTAATVTFASVKSPVARGGTAQVTVTTAPNVSCSITVTYASGPSTAQGLSPKTTDARGSVSWTWTIGATTTRGTWPIDVKCESATARATFVVQ